MDVRTGLSTKTSIEQRLTPQMLQSLALLPMTSDELDAYIRQEMESNPALELSENEEDNSLDTFLDNVDDDYDTDFDGDGDYSRGDRMSAIENAAGCGETLSDHLLAQLSESDVSETVRQAAGILISALDENGFLKLPLPELFEKTDLDANGDDVAKALELVRSFDPYGICVHDFRESLILQAKCSGLKDGDLKTFSALVNDHLENMKDGRNAFVAHSLGITEQDLDTFYTILKSLNPFPGRLYGNDGTNAAVPEFSIRCNEDGELELSMNRANLPELKLTPDFENLADEVSGPEAKEAKKYIHSSLEKARTLISQVELRYKTLYNTALALMTLQEPFFKKGPTFLRSMTMAQVARMIGVHESTVSRIAQAKWVDTDWGVFQLRYFFSHSSTVSNDSASLSRNAVKQLIDEMLADNPKLSDQKISDALAAKGITCSRRTVNKYRSSDKK